MSTDVRFFGGIDWASETHQVCLVAADGKIIGERAFAHGGAGLAEMCDWLVTTSGEEPPTVAVAIEVPHGPVVEILLERRFQVDAVNPKQLDHFRDRFTVADRLLAVACAMLKSQTTFNPEHAVEAVAA